MEIGLGLPNGGATVTTEDLVRLATGAEAAGLDAVWALERWLRPRRAVDVPGVPVPVELPADDTPASSTRSTSSRTSPL